jgi:hypothetical protein
MQRGLGYPTVARTVIKRKAVPNPVPVVTATKWKTPAVHHQPLVPLGSNQIIVRLSPVGMLRVGFHPTGVGPCACLGVKGSPVNPAVLTS